MLSTLNRRMGVLFLAVIALVTVSAVATMASVESQKTDALIINLAGRQRMLIQGMTGIAFQLGLEGQTARTAELFNLVETFDRTLFALINGGPAPYLPGQDVVVPAAETEILTDALLQTEKTWLQYQNILNVIATNNPSSSEFSAALENIENVSPTLLQSADGVVRLYESAAEGKIDRLRLIQLTFFFSMFLLLVLGFVMTRKSMLLPIRALASEAEKIGRGKFSTVVEIEGPIEVTSLAESLNSLRRRLLESQGELEERVHKRTHELAALREVSREITSRLDLDHVLRSVTNRARELLDCETAFICLLNDGGNELNLKAMSGPKNAIRDFQIKSEDPHVQLIMAEKEAVFCNGIGCDSSCKMITELHQRSHLAATLRVGGHTIGALCAASPLSNRFAFEDADLLTELANSAAIAIENAHIYADAERVAALEERNRIGAAIHDGLAQVMSYLELEIQELVGRMDDGQTKAELQSLYSSIRQASNEVRNSISGLYNPLSASRSLQSQLAETISELNSNDGIEIRYSIAQSPATILPINETEHVLRIINEAVLNARHHAQAENVNVIYVTDEYHNLLTIEDDGCGFDEHASPKDNRGHYGMRIMRARAKRLQGELTLDSKVGEGTKIVLDWPTNIQTLANFRSNAEGT